MNTILKDDKKLEVETESQMGATQGTENNFSDWDFQNADAYKEILTNYENLIKNVKLLFEKKPEIKNKFINKIKLNYIASTISQASDQIKEIFKEWLFEKYELKLEDNK